mmetsp:Transcript_16110/g.61001  ORF Transcript_16110/g.61001 Transcript_16110/m.61001 type:complete len:216 (+) Transcript_16110:611-1258(+)
MRPRVGHPHGQVGAGYLWAVHLRRRHRRALRRGGHGRVPAQRPFGALGPGHRVQDPVCALACVQSWRVAPVHAVRGGLLQGPCRSPSRCRRLHGQRDAPLRPNAQGRARGHGSRLLRARVCAGVALGPPPGRGRQRRHRAADEGVWRRPCHARVAQCCGPDRRGRRRGGLRLCGCRGDCARGRGRVRRRRCPPRVAFADASRRGSCRRRGRRVGS